jgi:hypothetical protein
MHPWMLVTWDLRHAKAAAKGLDDHLLLDGREILL